MPTYSQHYLLDKQIVIFQPDEGYHASSDAVLLASAVKNVKNKQNILDVGSGTGAVSLCVSARFQSETPQIFGLEVQKDLAELADLSAKQNGFKNIQFVNADILSCPFQPNSFDHVMTNPPYGEKDMPSPKNSKCTAHNFSTVPNLTEWLKFCLKMLKPRGYLYLINRAEALDEVLHTLYGACGEIKVMPLYSKKGQEAKRIMVCARKCSKGALKICAPFFVHDETGAYTSEAEEILRMGQGFPF